MDIVQRFSKQLEAVEYPKEKTSWNVAGIIKGTNGFYKFDVRDMFKLSSGIMAQNGKTTSRAEKMVFDIKDQWIIVDGLVKLHDANIPFAIDKGMLWSEWHKFIESLPSIIHSNIVHEDVGILSTCAKYSCKPNDDPGYHSDPKAQQVLAEMFYDKFNHSSI